MKYEKVSESELKVTKEVEIKTEEKTYDFDFLKQQEIDILKQENDFCEERDKELLEVRVLLAKCKELCIKSKVEVALEKELAE